MSDNFEILFGLGVVALSALSTVGIVIYKKIFSGFSLKDGDNKSYCYI